MKKVVFKKGDSSFEYRIVVKKDKIVADDGTNPYYTLEVTHVDIEVLVLDLIFFSFWTPIKHINITDEYDEEFCIDAAKEIINNILKPY